MARPAMAPLTENQKAQINLISKICGTRFKYHFYSVLVRTCCLNEYYGRMRARADCYEHLLTCCNLSSWERQDPAAKEFLVFDEIKNCD